ncbi:conserved hypothetical protein [Mesorhizobium ventifaucium]|uniref:Uncharacterized protein n=1 Tax=Mesorhizobium ventifaucium TaxID=666020 RepID=A0ABM9E7W7_9HYPH|nr:conserved hypothetical protein [Mesorhizobium ventifaucium]
MEKFLVPGAIIVAAIIGAATFRYDVLVGGASSQFVLIRDRWTGEVKYCGGSSGTSMCFAYLSRGMAPIRKAENGDRQTAFHGGMAGH